MKITLNKALKTKNELAGQLNRLKLQIATNNSVRESATRRFDVQSLYEQFTKLQEELVALKAKIAQANVPIYDKINMMAELKGEIGFLSTIDTKEGVIIENHYSENAIPVNYTATFTANVIAAKQSTLERKISALQDDIDTFNHNTFIEMPD